jgi:hypothetical protein
MKNVIIKINDISDIDTSKVSVYDLNNRYIDSNGIMYGLKYTKAARKIEVIKIVRTHEKNAGTYQQKIIEKKRGMHEAQMSGEEPAYTEANDETATGGFYNPEAFIEKTLELAATHRERIKGLIMNIRNSNIIIKENKTESNQLEDMFRNLEIDGIQGVDNLLNYQKELINYPRSLTYYQAKMDDRGRIIIEALANNNQKVIRFIYLAEMLDNIKILYKSIEKMIKKLKNFIEDRNFEEVKWVSTHEKQSYKDGTTSIQTTIREIENLQDDLTVLDEYTFNLENYS